MRVATLAIRYEIAGPSVPSVKQHECSVWSGCRCANMLIVCSEDGERTTRCVDPIGIRLMTLVVEEQYVGICREGRINGGIECRVDRRIERRVNLSVERDVDQRIEGGIDGGVERRVQLGIEGRINLRVESRIQLSVERRIDLRIERGVDG